MSTIEDDINSLLDSPRVEPYNPTGLISGTTNESSRGPLREPGYEGSIDYRIRQLSYSSRTLLHTCPRKFELYKRRTTFRELASEQQTITFGFGHVVGAAIQATFEGKSESEIIWRMFLDWPVNIFARDERRYKSLWEAIYSIKKFNALRSKGFLKEYELVYFEGKPACELSFSITLPDGFRYRGHVDAVLRHKLTGKIIVLECKTSSMKTTNPAIYKNSSQAIGYSIVLDNLFPELSSYEVLYLVYETGNQEFVPIPFQKTYLQRALWLRELLLDVEMIKLYEAAGVYPMHGESCVSFGQDCEYLNHCTMSTEYLTKPGSEQDFDNFEYQVNVSLLDLLNTQLDKTDAH